MPTPAPLNFESLRARLKLKAISSESTLQLKHPQAVKLFTAFDTKPGLIRAHAAKLLASSALASTLLLAPPPLYYQKSMPTTSAVNISSETVVSFKSQLETILPDTVTNLTPDQEQNVADLIKTHYGISSQAEYQGERLNRSYGYIGQEQHLKRFPGDTLDQHEEPLKEGIAPGLGAWGYFSPSKASLTPELKNVEKYYVAVQTLYLSDWYTRLAHLRDWWKYRKMVAVNPANGKLIVVAVGDSGPAWWTGKHFGGSPEVMQYLEMKDGRQKGPVVLFFLDDPDNSVPLGPLEYNLSTDPAIRT